MNPKNLTPDLVDTVYLEKVAPISGRVVTLPNSVFVSTGRFSLYLTLAAALCFGTAGYLLLSTKRNRKLIFVSDWSHRHGHGVQRVARRADLRGCHRRGHVLRTPLGRALAFAHGASHHESDRLVRGDCGHRPFAGASCCIRRRSARVWRFTARRSIPSAARRCCDIAP